ncbi:TIGR01244 family sulfur transferase [Sulfitobacter sp.]|uniref:TIGR01244 family sulfur transferase n=1 Tax=Sulfitobacter sp. TaxID=1903071 RepID=UPI0030010ABE
MDIRKASDTFSVSAQIGTNDIAVIAAMGFKSIVCNRPDGEADDQPLFEVIEDVAGRAGLQTAYLPVAPTGPVEADISEFQRIFANLPKPVLAYCRSGNRSLAIWAAGPEADVG